VAEISRVIRYDNIQNNLRKPPGPVVVNRSFPGDRHHGWKFIAFGPDGYLYVPVGAPAISASRERTFTQASRGSPDGSGFEIFARGFATLSVLTGTRYERAVVHGQRPGLDGR